MKFQIIKIVLWPRNPSFPPREVAIRPGALNVISGASKTGKSAIILIIDYCVSVKESPVPFAAPSPLPGHGASYDNRDGQDWRRVGVVPRISR